MALDQTSVGVLYASFSDTTPCSSKENHLPTFRKNYCPHLQGKKSYHPTVKMQQRVAF